MSDVRLRPVPSPGEADIPQAWRDRLALREVIEDLARRLCEMAERGGERGA